MSNICCYTCEIACERDHVVWLKQYIQNNCPYNRKTCVIAAEYGNLECLKYLREKNVNGIIVHVRVLQKMVI